MEYTIEEMQTMLKIVSAIVYNCHIEQCSAFCRNYTSIVYNIDDFDIATMEKWIAYWKKTIDAAKPTEIK